MKFLPLTIFITTLAATVATLAQAPAPTEPPPRVCGSVLQPPWPPLKDAEGRTILPPLMASEDGLTTWERGYVRDPVGVNCWVLGWIPYTKIVRAPDLPSVHEPVYRPGEEPQEKKP